MKKENKLPCCIVIISAERMWKIKEQINKFIGVNQNQNVSEGREIWHTEKDDAVILTALYKSDKELYYLLIM